MTEELIVAGTTLITVLVSAIAQELRRRSDSTAVTGVKDRVCDVHGQTTQILTNTNGASQAQLAEIKRLEGVVEGMRLALLAQVDADTRHDTMNAQVLRVLSALPCAPVMPPPPAPSTPPTPPR